MKRMFAILLFLGLIAPGAGRAAEELPPPKLTVESVQKIVDEIQQSEGKPANSQGEPALEAVPELLGEYEGQVTRILDALVIEIDGQRMHLAGLNAPLQTHWGRPVDCYSGEAAKFLEKLVKDRPVTYSYDPLIGIRDPYGVRFVYLYVDGKLVNAEMLLKGQAFADRVRKYAQKPAFFDAEAAARRHNIGVWHSCPVECVTTGCRSKNW
jgi:endonuclease YncB( thermonuclease family)